MTTADTAAERSGAAREGLLARHPLVFYFIIAYAGAWLLTMPLALSVDGAGLLPFSSPLSPLVAITVSAFTGPLLAAFVMTGVSEGRAGIGRLLRRMVLWRVGLRWYLFALVGIPVILMLGAVVMPGALASFQMLALWWVWFYPFALAAAFLGYGLSDEPGWRGFALPRLQRLHGPLVGSLILGPLWGLWHLPLFLWPTWNTPPNFPPTFLDIVFFVLTSIALSIVYTWVFNNTKGSVFMVMWLHSSQNAFWTGAVALLFPAPLVLGYGLVLPVLVGFGAAALVIVALTRGRLGYERYRQEAEEEPAPATARW